MSLKVYKSGNTVVVAESKPPGDWVVLKSGEMMPKEPCEVALKPFAKPKWLRPYKVIPWGGINRLPSKAMMKRLWANWEKTGKAE